VRKSLYSPEQKALQEILQQVRQERGLLQSQLAERLGMSQSYVSRYEGGVTLLDIPELVQICKALETDFLEFMTRYSQALQNLPVE
jgi:transcriptional regulator with XRE-family HTH domain